MYILIRGYVLCNFKHILLNMLHKFSQIEFSDKSSLEMLSLKRLRIKFIAMEGYRKVCKGAIYFTVDDPKV